MPVPTRITDLSATAGSNPPAGTDTISTSLDDYFRAAFQIMRGDLASKGADIASATTTDLGAVQGLFHDITGTTTITGFGTVAAGIWKVLKFEGVLTLTHNATSLIIPGGASITTAVGDMLMATSEGSGNWRVNWYMPAVSYLRSDGGSLTGALNEAQGVDIASAATVNLDTATGNLVDVTGTTTITAITLSQGRQRVVRFTGILTLTNGASLVLPGGANITTAAGDFAVFEGYAAGVVRCIVYSKASGAPVTMSPITNSLGSDVALNNAANYFDGPSVAQGTAGTWFVSGTVTVDDSSIAASISAKLWDGTTVIASALDVVQSANRPLALALSGFLAAPAANLRISCKSNSTSSIIRFNSSGNSKDSTITAIRIA